MTRTKAEISEFLDIVNESTFIGHLTLVLLLYNKKVFTMKEYEAYKLEAIHHFDQIRAADKDKEEKEKEKEGV